MIRRYNGSDLARVLIYYGVILDVSSSEFNVCCCFHDDPKPSMSIKLTNGTFYCFGCGVSGNAYDFVRLAQPELNELQACLLLEKILHSDEIKKLTIKYKRKRKSSGKQALDEAHDYYYGLKSIDWYRVTTGDEKAILSYMEQRGFDRRALNLSDCRVNYNIAYPFLFPILDNKQFKGWVGRTTNRHVESRRKYLYNEGFRKRDTLCGNYKKDSIVYICEGFFDYLSLRSKGRVKNVVAIFGWHISDEQVNKLKQQNITTVISALDNDESGKKGTEYLKKFFNVIQFQFPDNIKDTGEMSEQQIKASIRKTLRKVKQNENLD